MSGNGERFSLPMAKTSHFWARPFTRAIVLH